MKKGLLCGDHRYQWIHATVVLFGLLGAAASLVAFLSTEKNDEGLSRTLEEQGQRIEHVQETTRELNRLLRESPTISVFHGADFSVRYPDLLERLEALGLKTRTKRFDNLALDVLAGERKLFYTPRYEPLARRIGNILSEYGSLATEQANEGATPEFLLVWPEVEPVWLFFEREEDSAKRIGELLRAEGYEVALRQSSKRPCGEFEIRFSTRRAQDAIGIETLLQGVVPLKMKPHAADVESIGSMSLVLCLG